MLRVETLAASQLGGEFLEDCPECPVGSLDFCSSLFLEFPFLCSLCQPLSFCGRRRRGYLRQSHTNERVTEKERERHGPTHGETRLSNVTSRSSKSNPGKAILSIFTSPQQWQEGHASDVQPPCDYSRGGCAQRQTSDLVHNSVYKESDLYRVLWRLWFALVTLSVTCGAVGARYGTCEDGPPNVLNVIFGTVLAAMQCVAIPSFPSRTPSCGTRVAVGNFWVALYVFYCGLGLCGDLRFLHRRPADCTGVNL